MAEMNNPQLQGTVQHIDGIAWLKLPDGRMIVLKPGDHVHPGDVIVTGPNAHVELALPTGAPLEIGPDRTVLADQDILSQSAPDKSEAAILPPDTDADRVIAALNAGQDPFSVVEPAEAGLVAGDQDSGHSFVRLLRITEDVTPVGSSTTSAFVQETVVIPDVNTLHHFNTDTTQTTPPQPLPNTIDVSNITADNIINASESGHPIAVSGTVGAAYNAGDTVTLSVGGNTYTGTVAPDHTFSIPVPGSVLATNSTVSASATNVDASGIVTSISVDHAYGVDLSATATITVAPITSDNIVNAAEASGPIAVTGTTGGDAQPGDTVTLTIGGTPYTGTVAVGNTYSIDVPGSALAANTSVHAVVGGTDAAGNPFSAPSIMPTASI